jgi:hypothetical protein
VDGTTPLRLNSFYGEPKWEDIYKSCEYIRDFHTQLSMPWLLLGDFNEILFHGRIKEVHLVHNVIYKISKIVSGEGPRLC